MVLHNLFYFVPLSNIGPFTILPSTCSFVRCFPLRPLGINMATEGGTIAMVKVNNKKIEKGILPDEIFCILFEEKS